MYKDEIEKIKNYISSMHPLFFIHHSDFFAITDILNGLKREEDFKYYKFYKYTNSLGSKVEYSAPFDADDNEIEDPSEYLEDWLEVKYNEACEGRKQILVLKDIISDSLSSVSISYIKEIAEKNVTDEKFCTIIFIVESKSVFFPKELESMITIVDIKPLNEEDIKTTIRRFVKVHNLKCLFIDNTEKLDEFVYSFKGLLKYQIEQILCTAVLQGHGELLSNNVQAKLVLKEKEQMIKKSGILEIINQSSDFEEIGGLKNLKKWLKNKKIIYEDIFKAKSYGVEIPKGILIAGMPGCGKSLVAKATASLFNVPLVRLDVSSLLGKYIGESEDNMRKALSLSESFSPCVLWIDELEKAFAGINANEDGGVVMRLFGQFLTWMQEKSSAVFIVATANDINSLPPEFLRKGRFDELFFVDLPTENERRDIFKLKFGSKKKDLTLIDFQSLAKETEGYSGSDIESIVNSVIEKKYIEEYNQPDNSTIQITTEFIMEIVKSKKSISQMLGDKIKVLREKYKELNLINASEDI